MYFIKIMGNINYKNFVCDNYYCQPVSFKPEWLSESSWSITYLYENKKETTDNETINKDITEINEKKPYIIDKGILKIENTKKFYLLLIKKLLINFNEIRYLSVPINFSYTLHHIKIEMFIIFSNNQLILEDIYNLKETNNLFFINLIFLKNKIIIYRSFNDKIITKKIKMKKINSFHLTIENNFNVLLLTEKLCKNNITSIYEEKYLNMFNLDNLNDMYLSLYIKSNNNMEDKEFIQLNFE
jgi:hypothetical protein